jgi:hypothetical protein
MNEELAELPCEARLLFIGLWTIADRDGRLEDRPRKIKAAVFPYENLDVDTLLDLLAGKKFLKRYRIKGLACIEIDNFLKHQKPHPKEPPSLVPAADDEEDDDEEERGARNAECGVGAAGEERGVRNAECGVGAERGDHGACREESGLCHEKVGHRHEIQGSDTEKPGLSHEVQMSGSEPTRPRPELEPICREIERASRELERSSRVLPALTKDRRIEGRQGEYSEEGKHEPEEKELEPEKQSRDRNAVLGPERQSRDRNAVLGPERQSRDRNGVLAPEDRAAGGTGRTGRLRRPAELVYSDRRAESRDATGSGRVRPKSEVETVFDYWKRRTGHPDAKLTREREMKIRARLDEGYSLDELQEAIEGCRGSPFHQGDNDRGHRYDDITLICRSGSKVEQFIEMARENRDETRQCGHRSNVRKIMQGIELVRSRAAESRDTGDDNKQSEDRLLTAGAGT